MKKHDENSQLEMLEGAKSIGAGAATIALAGAAVGIGNVLSSSIHSVARNPSLAKQLFGYAIGLCSNRSYCIVCPNDGLSDLIRIPIELKFHKASTSFFPALVKKIGGGTQFLNRRMAITIKRLLK